MHCSKGSSCSCSVLQVQANLPSPVHTLLCQVIGDEICFKYTEVSWLSIHELLRAVQSCSAGLGRKFCCRCPAAVLHGVQAGVSCSSV